MKALLELLLVPILGAAGWILAGRLPRAGYLINFGAGVALLALWILGTASGLFGLPLAIHRKLGQVLVLCTCIASPLAAGIFVRHAVDEEEKRDAIGALAAGLSIVLIMITASTGYMGPSHGTLGAGNSLRFTLLHLIAMPLLSGGSLAVWTVMARPAKER